MNKVEVEYLLITHQVGERDWGLRPSRDRLTGNIVKNTYYILMHLTFYRQPIALFCVQFYEFCQELFNHHQNQETEQFSHQRPVCHQPSTPNPWQPLIWFRAQSLSLPECSIHGIVQHM